MRGQTRGNDSLTGAGRSSGVDLRTIGGTSRGHVRGQRGVHTGVGVRPPMAPKFLGKRRWSWRYLRKGYFWWSLKWREYIRIGEESRKEDVFSSGGLLASYPPFYIHSKKENIRDKNYVYLWVKPCAKKSIISRICELGSFNWVASVRINCKYKWCK